jgi:ubiquinone/menaquinone biosynthesis C-methylase UbiE
VRWAIEVLDPAGAEEILEIGGGPGVAAALVCERLTTGRLVAVDRSRIATERIAKRNTAHMDSGRLSVQQCSLAALAVPPRSFDKAFAINVNLFWVADPSRELQVLSRALRPSGVLYILFGAGGPTRPTGSQARSAPLCTSMASPTSPSSPQTPESASRPVLLRQSHDATRQLNCGSNV